MKGGKGKKREKKKARAEALKQMKGALVLGVAAGYVKRREGKEKKGKSPFIFSSQVRKRDEQVHSLKINHRAAGREKSRVSLPAYKIGQS